jgi:lysophospholipase L1-like esterase
MQRLRIVVVRLFGYLFLTLFFLEISLSLASKVYLFFYKPNEIKETTVKDNKHNDEKFTIMLIGDSWTEGAEAKKGEGYTDILMTFLREKYSDMHFELFNYAKGSFNSSEACIIFVRNYKSIRPDLLIVLFGINNGWNTQDVNLAFHLLENDLGFFRKYSERLRILEKLRIVRLYRILKFEFYLKNQKMQYGHPSNDFSSEYFHLRNQEKIDEALDYLIQNYEKAPTYDDFYKLVLYHFGYNSHSAKKLLKEKKCFKPTLIKMSFSQIQHDNYIKKSGRIIKDQIYLLKKICDSNNIILLLQSYPEVTNEAWSWKKHINSFIRDAVSKKDIYFVDHERIFEESFTKEKWQEITTGGKHVNAKGYSIMAKNLYNYLLKMDLIK